MSLRKDHTFSIGAVTSNAIVPSGIARHILAGAKYGSVKVQTVAVRRQTCLAKRRKGPRASPEMPRRMGSRGADSALSQERKAGALVHADLAVLRHFVHRFAAFRFPLTEEVDRYFRSLLQFHISRVQRPSLVRLRHVCP